jgi:LysR family tcuABC transcriptional regulator
MELRQLRYFVRAVETGSINRAAKDLGLVTSALSQQLSRLEGELCTRLLHRTASGVATTDAGQAFYEQAQLALRHVEYAVRSAQQARLSGHVNVGMASSTASVLELPFVHAMQLRYPEVRVRLVESLSATLLAQLNARKLDLAVLFETDMTPCWGSEKLVEERMFLLGLRTMPELQDIAETSVSIRALVQVPLVLGSHGMRSVVDEAFARVHCEPRIALEVDSLAILMDMVSAGVAATIQSGAATTRLVGDHVRRIEISDQLARRRTIVSSLSEDEMTPAALGARLVLKDVARDLVSAGRWPGAVFTNHDKPVSTG